MLGEELTTWRKARNMTQQDVGTLAGVSRQAVINWEKGVHPIPDAIAAKLLAASTAPAIMGNAQAGQRRTHTPRWSQMTLAQKRDTYATVRRLCERAVLPTHVTEQEMDAWLNFPRVYKRKRPSSNFPHDGFYVIVPPELDEPDGS